MRILLWLLSTTAVYGQTVSLIVSKPVVTGRQATAAVSVSSSISVTLESWTFTVSQEVRVTVTRINSASISLRFERTDKGPKRTITFTLDSATAVRSDGQPMPIQGVPQSRSFRL